RPIVAVHPLTTSPVPIRRGGHLCGRARENDQRLEEAARALRPPERAMGTAALATAPAGREALRAAALAATAAHGLPGPRGARVESACAGASPDGRSGRGRR